MARDTGETRATARRQLDRLRAVKMAGGAQLATYVAELISETREPEVLEAALAALPATPPAELARPLRDAWAFFAANGKRRDPGGFVRTSILRALAPIATQDDREAFIAAIETFERTPQDDTGPGVLRAAGIAGLHHFDPELAAAYAASLLANEDGTSRMTGEPAFTAARVLFATGHELTLYVYAMTAAGAPAEVLAECLRSMAALPAPLIANAVRQFSGSPDSILLLGLCDLVVEANLGAEARGLLKDIEDDDVLASLATTIVASRKPALVAVLLEHAKTVTQEGKLRAIAGALELMPGDPAAGEALAAVRKKLSR